MIGGFALVAYPAKYGTSGIMTLIVNHDGVVYEKDLGKKTEAFVKAMTTFDPDKTWRKVEGKHLEPSVSSRRGGKSLNAFLRRLPVLRLSSQQIKPRGTGGESRSPRGLVTPVQ
jgi:hypothetical protein